ncbi:MAG: translocation/assembly module TamB domain-containing protein [Armatimonadota bacterium]
MKRLLGKLAPILVPAAIIMGAAATALSESDWLTKRVEQIIRVQLADRTGRQVRVGEVRGNLLGSIVIRDLAIAEPGGFDQGTTGSIREIHVRFRGKDALLGEVAPLSSITALRIVGADLKATRDETGEIDLVRMFRPRLPRKPPTGDRLQVPILVQDASLEYVDHALPTLDQRPVRLRLSKARGSVDLSRPDWVHVRAKGQNPDGAFGELDASVRVNGKRGIVLIEAQATDVAAVPWAQRFLPSPQVQAVSGRLDAKGSIYSFRGARGKWRTGYSLAGKLRGGVARLGALRGEAVSVSGPLRFTGDTLSTELLKLRGPGITGTVAGAVFGLTRQPALNLHVIADTLHLERLRELGLFELPPRLAAVTSRLPASGSFDLAGTWPRVTVAGTVDVPALSADDPDSPLPQWALEGVHASFLVSDPAEPSLEAQATARRASAVLPEGTAPIALGVLGGRALRASLNWRPATGLAANLTADDLTLAGVPEAEFSARADLANGAAGFQLAGRALRGTITAHGRASWPDQGEPAVSLAGRVAGLDVAGARDLTLVGPKADDLRGQLAQFPAGRVSGDCRLEASPSAVRVAFTGDVEGAVYHHEDEEADEPRDYQIPDASVAGRVAASARPGDAGRTSEWQLDSGSVYASTDAYGGRAWVRASYPFPAEGPGVATAPGRAAYRLEVSALGLDVAQLAQALGQEDVGGAAYVLADLKLAPDQQSRLRLLPSQARLVALAPRWKDYGLDAAVVRAAGDLDRLEIEEARAYQGPSSARATGLVTQIDTDERDASLDLAVSMQESQLKDWLLAAASDVDAQGTLTASGRVAGTVKEPTAEGDATLLHGGVLGYEVDYAHSPVAYAGRKLTLADLRVEGYGGTASASLTVDELLDPEKRALDGAFSAQKLWLSRLPLPIPEAIDLHGALAAEGKIGGLAMDPEMSASLQAPDLRLNGHPFREFAARVTYGHDVVEVSDLSVSGLSGAAGIERASYDRVSRKLKGRAQLQQIRVGKALRLGADLAADAEKSPDGLRRAAELVHGRLNGTLAVDGVLAERDDGGLSIGGLPSSVELELTRLTLDGKHLPDVRGTLELEGAAVRAADVRAVEPGIEFTLTGSADPEGDLDVTLDASDLDLAFLERWLPRPTGLQGKAKARVVARGPWEEPALQVQDGVMLITGLGRARRPGAEEAPPDTPEQKITFAAHLPLTTDPLGLREGADLSAEAAMQGADLAFFPALIDHVVAAQQPAGEVAVPGREPPPALAELLSASGTVNSRLTLSGTPEAPVLGGGVTVANGRIALNGAPLPLEDIHLEAAFRRADDAPDAPNRLELTHFTARLGDTYVSAPRAHATTRSLAAEDLKTAGLDIVLVAWSPLQDFGHKLKVGKIGVEIRAAREQGQTATQVTFERVGGKVGSGSIELLGGATIENYSLAALHTNPMDIKLRLKDTEPRYLPYLDGRLRTVGPDGIHLHGPGKGEPAVIEGKLLVSHAGIGVQRPAAAEAPGQYILGASPALPAPQLDLSLDLGHRVAVKLPGLRVPLAEKTNAITLRGTPQAPELRVSVDGRKGSLTLPGRTLTVRRGGVTYALLPSQRRPYQGRIILEPESRIEGELLVTVADHDITISLSGPAHSPHLRMTSRPPESEDKIFHLIFGGVPAEMVADQPLTEAAVVALGNAAVGQIESRLISEISEVFIGTGLIDQLAVEGVLTGTPTVEVGKFLLEDLYVQFRKVVQVRRQEGLPEEFDFKMSYRVQDRYQVSFSTDEERDNRVAIEYRLNF